MSQDILIQSFAEIWAPELSKLFCMSHTHKQLLSLTIAFTICSLEEDRSLIKIKHLARLLQQILGFEQSFSQGFNKQNVLAVLDLYQGYAKTVSRLFPIPMQAVIVLVNDWSYTSKLIDNDIL